MNIEFKLFRVKESSIHYDTLVTKSSYKNEFIIVGEIYHNDVKHYKVHQMDNDGSIALIKGMKIDEFYLMVPKADIEILKDDPCSFTAELDIPKEHLTLDIIEKIEKLQDEVE